MPYLEQLSKKIISGKYEWAPVKRIWIPKPGKSTKRPLGLPDFEDKLVQNCILTTLQSIYEPEFEHVGCNFGFRPKKSCNDTIQTIRDEERGSDYAIEGDIEGAYNNVDHPTLINILRKRIKDEKLLTLIYNGLKAGIMEDGIYEDSFLGVPQGGIVSPLLFNIYMNEFDKFIIHDLNKFVIDINNKRSGKTTAVTTEYYKLDSRVDRARAKQRKFINLGNKSDFLTSKGFEVNSLTLADIFHRITNNKYKKEYAPLEEEILETTLSYPEQQIFTKYNTNRNSKNRVKKSITDYSPEQQLSIRKGNRHDSIKGLIRKKIKEILTTDEDLMTQAFDLYKKTIQDELQTNLIERRKTTYTDVENKVVKYLYYRYADDWIILQQGSKQVAELIRDKIEQWLAQVLKMKLAKDKTNITNIRTHKALLLGYELYYQTNPQLIVKKDARFNEGHALQRYKGLLQVMPDKNRLEKRFHWKNFLDENDKPREIGFLCVLKDHEIIEKYNQMIVGLGNYYIIQISEVSALNRWHYILFYSCLKTLACKHKTTISKIIDSYGHLDLSNPNVNPQQKKQQVNNLRIVSSYTLNNNEIKYKTLLNYHEFMATILPLRERYRDKISPIINPIDFDTMYKTNWRTQFKLQTYCSLCGSGDNLENHHIDPIKHAGDKFTGYKGFDKLVASLGRKQLTVCRTCHNKITYGKYDGVSLKDFYEIRLVAPEGLIRLNQQFDTPIETPTKSKTKNQIEIDPKKKTYFSSTLNEYFRR
jgi:retron-type reverse transcriptase